MKKVGILLPNGEASISCIEGAVKIFTTVNDFLPSGSNPAFEVQLVAEGHESVVYDKFFSIRPQKSIKDSGIYDLIIIPAVNGEMKEVIRHNANLVSWIREQHRHGAELASLCVGSFLLASTGLLEGKKCSTHWMAAPLFREMFPGVELVSEKVITDERGLYSSGGANSFWNLLLYIVEKYISRDVAITIAKYYEIDIGRQSQNAFIMFQAQRQHSDREINKAQEYIESNFGKKLNVNELCDMLAIGRRSFERRFKKATQHTVAEYIQRVKIEAAKKSFESGGQNVNEIMYEVGYNDHKAFRSVFRRFTGLSPQEYRNKYRRMLAA